MTLEGWKTFFDVGALVLLAFTFVFALGAWYTTNRLNVIQEKELNNLKLETSENKKEAARLTKVAEDERLARVRLEEALAWRRLTKEQEHNLGASLRRFEGELTQLTYDAGDREAEIFAWDIWQTLKMAQWKVFAPATVMSLRQFGNSVATGPGLAGILVTPEATPGSQEASKALVGDLNRFGFDAAISLSEVRIEKQGIQISVTTRPLGPQGAAKLRIQSENKDMVRSGSLTK